MKELIEYRSSLINRVLEAAAEFCEICKAEGPKTQLEGGWTIHQLASHTRDVQGLVYGFRARKTVDDANPIFENFDADHWMASHYNSKEDLDAILDEFMKNITEQAHWLGDLPPEAWNRVSQHVTMGKGYTLQTWVERGLAHIEEHLKMAKTKKGE